VTKEVTPGKRAGARKILFTWEEQGKVLKPKALKERAQLLNRGFIPGALNLKEYWGGKGKIEGLATGIAGGKEPVNSRGSIRKGAGS